MDIPDFSVLLLGTLELFLACVLPYEIAVDTFHSVFFFWGGGVANKC